MTQCQNRGAALCVWIRRKDGKFRVFPGMGGTFRPLTGTILENERAEEAAAREIAEQLGVQIGDFGHLASDTADGSEVLLAQWDEKGESADEKSETVWASFDELCGKLTDEKTETAFRLYFQYLRNCAAAICPLTMADYGEVYALWKNMPGMGLNDIDDSEEGIGRYLRRNPDTCFLAKTARGLVGTVLAGHDGRRGYLYHAAVHPDVQGMGVGRALTETAMDALAREGVSKAGLMVFTSNELGCRFWDKMGFSDRSDVRYRSIRLER